MQRKTHLAILSFPLSETDNWKEEDQDQQHSLRLTFSADHWQEPHPYGNGVAHEPLWEPADDTFEWELDGKAVTQPELQARFGSDWLERTTESMLDRADEV